MSSAGHPAVLVDDDGHGPAVLAHVRQRLQDAEGLGQEVGLAHLARDLQRAGVGGVPGLVAVAAGRDPGRFGPEDVVDEQDADQVVEVVVDDREAAVPRRAHGLGDVLGVHRNGEVRDVDPRRHHLAHVHVAQVGEGLGDEPLLLGGLSLERLGSSRLGPAGSRRRRATAATVVVIVATRPPPGQGRGSGPACSWGPPPTSTGTGVNESSA